MHSRILHRQDLDPSGASTVSGTLQITGGLILGTNTAVTDPVTLAPSFTLTVTSTHDVPATSMPSTVSTKAASPDVKLPILATLGGFIFLVILSMLFLCRRRHVRRTPSVIGKLLLNLYSRRRPEGIPSSAAEPHYGRRRLC